MNTIVQKKKVVRKHQNKRRKNGPQYETAHRRNQRCEDVNMYDVRLNNMSLFKKQIIVTFGWMGPLITPEERTFVKDNWIRSTIKMDQWKKWRTYAEEDWSMRKNQFYHVFSSNTIIGCKKNEKMKSRLNWTLKNKTDFVKCLRSHIQLNDNGLIPDSCNRPMWGNLSKMKELSFTNGIECCKYYHTIYKPSITGIDYYSTIKMKIKPKKKTKKKKKKKKKSSIYQIDSTALILEIPLKLDFNNNNIIARPPKLNFKDNDVVGNKRKREIENEYSGYTKKQKIDNVPISLVDELLYQPLMNDKPLNQLLMNYDDYDEFVLKDVLMGIPLF